MKKVNIRTLLFLYVIGCLAGTSTLLAANAELLSKLENSDAAGSDSSISVNTGNSNSVKIEQSYLNTIDSSDTERSILETKELSSAESVVELAPSLETAFNPESASSEHNNTIEKRIKQENKDMNKTLYIEHIINQGLAIETPQSIDCALTYSEEEMELLGILESISRKNKHLFKTSHYNDKKTINEIIKYKNEIVVKLTRTTGELENKTLWEVLHACNNEFSIDIDSENSNYIKNIILLYPIHMLSIPSIKHAILTYYNNPREASSISLSLKKFIFGPNESVFNQYAVFSSANKLMLDNLVIYTDTLNALDDFNNLKELSFYMGSILSSNTELEFCLPENLEKLKLCCVDKEHVNWILSGANSCCSLKEIDISDIDFIDTAGLNSMANLETITTFTLNNIVISGYPDFAFLKKMQALQKLTMDRIFYSYKDDFELMDVYEIKKNIEYLNPISLPDYSPVLGQIEPAQYADVIKNNKTVGEYISPTNICINSKLYNDLGLCKVIPKKGHACNMCVIFTEKVDYVWIYSIKFMFSINSKHTYLNINAKSAALAKPILLNYIQCIDFPFSGINTIDEMYFVNSLKEFSESTIISMFYDQMLKYTKYNKVRRLQLVSLVQPVTVDIYRIVMFNSNIPDLEEIYFSNIVFTKAQNKPKTADEERALESYAAYIQASNDSANFKCKLIKNGNNFKITESS
ncbi:hypothetical protein NEIRO03_0333 [Nematocida sp. AWRm78]|nr:hypothetical protein NEIRO02_0423 [Nematocida sp. AWRm79]KAI5182682.1 hypothetical protein NEIRO03_0333 [Nematocida sp. AWRm78]